MKIKLLLLLLFMLSISTNMFSQIQENKVNEVGIASKKNKDSIVIKIDYDFFLLGTLNDYMGRKWVAKGEIFDRYYTFEKPLMKFVDSIVKNEFKISLIEKDNCFNSEEMSKKMNSYYNENELIHSFFTSKEKKISFILGAYYRYGEKVNENIYKIQIANSYKHIEIYQFLLSLGCKNIYYKRVQNIPAQNILYFEANELIKECFKTIELEKEKLFESLFESFKSMKISKEDYIKEMDKRNLKVIELFNGK